VVDIGQPSGPCRAGGDQATIARLGIGGAVDGGGVVEGAMLVGVAATTVVLGSDGGVRLREITRRATSSVTAAMAIAAARRSLACASTCHLSGTVHPLQCGHRDPSMASRGRRYRLQRVAGNIDVPSRGGPPDRLAATRSGGRVAPPAAAVAPESLRGAQPSQGDRDEPADRDLRRQAAGGGEGVQARGGPTSMSRRCHGGGCRCC